MKPERDFALEVHFSRWEFKAEYNLGGSDLETLTLGQLLEMADSEDRAAWDRLPLGYTETWGRPELKAALAGLYDRAEPDDLLCFCGAEEGIFAAVQAILGPEDHALVCHPNYQSAETLPRSICEVTGVYMDPDRDWTIDLDFVRDHIRPNTRLIYVNFPHNPTGKILERDKFDALVDMCRKHGIYLFSDEVYRLMERDPARRLPQAADLYERGLSLNVMSKAYGLAGLRIGWIACRDRELLSRMERIKHYLSICNSAPSELLAQIAIKARDRILARNRELLDRNLALVNDFFSRWPDRFEWRVPDGGCIAYPRYLGPEGVEAFCGDLVNGSGVILLPASVYRSDLGPTPDDRFRIGFGRSDAPEALQRVEAYLAHPKSG
jgi:aspartate/methionine/tyrosine aminotransferase